MSLFAGGITHPFDGEVNDVSLRRWLVEELAVRAGRAPKAIDTTASFDSYGLDSRTAVEPSRALEKILDRRPSPAVLLDHPCVDDLLAHLVAGATVPALAETD